LVSHSGRFAGKGCGNGARQEGPVFLVRRGHPGKLLAAMFKDKYKAKGNRKI